eukprot:12969570-Alexandrium_andersonii.AAC.1
MRARGPSGSPTWAAWRSPLASCRPPSLSVSTSRTSRPGAARPAVGCSAPPYLLAVPRLRVAVARWRWRVACAVLRRLSARPRSGSRLVDGGAPRL